MSTDYEREKLRKLETFESKVHSAMRNIGYAVGWIWVVLGIGLPVFAWFKPLPEHPALQSIVFVLVIWFLFIVSKVEKYVAKLEE